MRWAFENAEGKRIPLPHALVQISEKNREKLEALIEILKSHEDVGEVYLNT